MLISPCPSCAGDVPAGSRFCASCGFPIGAASQVSTREPSHRPVPLPAERVQRLVSSDSIPVGGFTPGAMLADRYRIIGLLGRGGMGEVYRADDVKLGQPVALKFLPKALAGDPVRRERFFAEVRITRQLSHPNICRVYDIAEIDGVEAGRPTRLHFLSMEYIDGEDLASLLKRIGYLSNEKALDIARQLAAGLAAAHDRGVLHRDLKPANIMLDGHGRVRITDFGLAIAAADEEQAADASGTPAYMAPEQLAGKGASVRSDIYALGLVLYEIYSGKRAFTATTIAELREQKEGRTPTAPSEIRPGVDPVVERLIMRCLERDPRARPASVAQLATALPGGDPLAAALAAGETPSPEMLIASGSKEGLRPAAAVGLLATVILGLLAYTAMSDPVGIVQRMTLTKSPDALTERAREFLKAAGYAEDAADGASGFFLDSNIVRYVQGANTGERTWSTLDALGAVGFFYRQSPRLIVGMADIHEGVLPDDPPLRFPGELEIRLDGKGRLRAFEAVPPRDASSPARIGELDWTVMFTEAGLDLARWTPTEPQTNPVFYADTRAAWRGALPDAPGTPIRIEAAAYRGRPVTFEVVGPWTPATPTRALLAGRFLPTFRPSGFAFASLVLTAALGGGLFFARRNVRLGRGDRRSATRLAMVVMATGMIGAIFREHHVAAAEELSRLGALLGETLVIGASVWVFYIAVEPSVRRRWPQILVSWTRVFSGDWRDPMVGRAVLVGGAAGVVLACLNRLSLLTSAWLGQPTTLSPPDWAALGRTAPLIGGLLANFSFIVFAFGLTSLLILFLLRVVLRHDMAAAVVYVLVLAADFSATGGGTWVSLTFAAIASVVSFFVLWRVGLVAITVAVLVGQLNFYPLTLRTSAWYASSGYVVLLLIVAISLFGFRTSLGGRPLLDTLGAEE
jgi:hypothetical protein